MSCTGSYCCGLLINNFNEVVNVFAFIKCAVIRLFIYNDVPKTRNCCRCSSINDDNVECLTLSVCAHRNFNVKYDFCLTLCAYGLRLVEDVTAKYKNPRNLCSGSVRQLNNKITAERNVLFYVFALISTDSDMEFATRSLTRWLIRPFANKI